MNDKYIVVFDFETDDKIPESDTCNPIQLAAVVLNPQSLEILDNKFNVNIRPDDIEDKDYYKNHKSTIDWHCKNAETTPEEFISTLKKGVPEKLAWENFNTFLKQYHTRQSRQSMFTAPIPAGANISRFDLKIVDRLNKKYKIKNSFYARDNIDIQHFTFYWWESRNDVPRSHSMDSIREYFGLSSEGAHGALKDVMDEAQIIVRFMKLHRKVNIKFKDAFK